MITNRATADSSLLQFGLRGVVAAVTVSAVACAITAPWIRAIPRDRQVRVAAAVGSAILGTAILTAFVCYRRWRIEQARGRLLLAVPLGRQRTWIAVSSSVMQACVLIWMLRASTDPKSPIWFFLLSLGFCALVAFHLTMALLQAWWREKLVSLDFCENGIIFNALNFRSWKSLVGTRWNLERGSIWFPPSTYRNFPIVPPEQRPEVQRILAEYIPEKQVAAV